MNMAYRYRDAGGDELQIHPATFIDRETYSGIKVQLGDEMAYLPDDEIPNLISALQDYMSRRAKQLSRAANESR